MKIWFENRRLYIKLPFWLKSLIFFFFPPKVGIWPDAAAWVDDNGREHHVSYTLRNFAVHWFYTLFVIPFRTKDIDAFRRFVLGFASFLFSLKFGTVGTVWYVGAIAFDSAAAGVTGANPSGTLTVTGSNTVAILTTVSGNSTDPTAASYNSVALTKDVSKNSVINSSNQTIWHLLNPSTGSNTWSVTHTGGRVQIASYTGVAQSGFPDATATSTVDQARVGAGDITYTLTVVASGCWVVQTNEDNVLNPTGGVIAGTLRGGETTYGSGRINDSNGTVSTGAISVGYSYSGTNSMTGVAISFAPATSTFIPQVIII